MYVLRRSSLLFICAETPKSTGSGGRGGEREGRGARQAGVRKEVQIRRTEEKNSNKDRARRRVSRTKLDLAVVGQQNVLALDVAVNHEVFMEKLQGAHRLVEHVGNNLRAQEGGGISRQAELQERGGGNTRRGGQGRPGAEYRRTGSDSAFGRCISARSVMLPAPHISMASHSFGRGCLSRESGSGYSVAGGTEEPQTG